MKKFFTTLPALLLVVIGLTLLASCNRIKEARETVSGLAEAVKAVEEVAKSVDMDALLDTIGAMEEAEGGGDNSGTTSSGVDASSAITASSESNPGKLTITGLPSGEYAAWVFKSGTDISNMTAVKSAYDNGSVQASSAPASGNVFTLYGSTVAGAWTAAWTGSGSLPVLLYKDTDKTWSYATLSFSNGVGTAQFSGFKAITASAGGGTQTSTASGGSTESSGGNPGKLTVTGLPSGEYAAWVFKAGTNISTLAAVKSAYDNGSVQASSSAASGNVFTLYGPGAAAGTWTAAWTGSGSLPVLLYKNSDKTWSSATLNFSNGVGTAQFSGFKAVK